MSREKLAYTKAAGVEKDARAALEQRRDNVTPETFATLLDFYAYAIEDRIDAWADLTRHIEIA